MARSILRALCCSLLFLTLIFATDQAPDVSHERIYSSTSTYASWSRTPQILADSTASGTPADSGGDRLAAAKAMSLGMNKRHQGQAGKGTTRQAGNTRAKSRGGRSHTPCVTVTATALAFAQVTETATAIPAKVALCGHGGPAIFMCASGAVFWVYLTFWILIVRFPFFLRWIDGVPLAVAIALDFSKAFVLLCLMIMNIFTCVSQGLAFLNIFMIVQLWYDLFEATADIYYGVLDWKLTVSHVVHQAEAERADAEAEDGLPLFQPVPSWHRPFARLRLALDQIRTRKVGETFPDAQLQVRAVPSPDAVPLSPEVAMVQPFPLPEELNRSHSPLSIESGHTTARQHEPNMDRPHRRALPNSWAEDIAMEEGIEPWRRYKRRLVAVNTAYTLRQVRILQREHEREVQMLRRRSGRGVSSLSRLSPIDEDAVAHNATHDHHPMTVVDPHSYSHRLSHSLTTGSTSSGDRGNTAYHDPKGSLASRRQGSDRSAASTVHARASLPGVENEPVSPSHPIYENVEDAAPKSVLNLGDVTSFSRSASAHGSATDGRSLGSRIDRGLHPSPSPRLPSASGSSRRHFAHSSTSSLEPDGRLSASDDNVRRRRQRQQRQRRPEGANRRRDKRSTISYGFADDELDGHGLHVHMPHAVLERIGPQDARGLDGAETE